MPHLEQLLLALGAGLLVLAASTGLDIWERRKRLRAIDLHIAQVDEHRPDYILPEDITSVPRHRESPPPIPDATRLSFGHADPRFATHNTHVRYDDARILVVDDDVTAIRELLTPLQLWEPLVVAARNFHPIVLETLVVNHRAGRQFVAVTTSSERLAELAKAVGADPLSAIDLQSGYVPEAAIGHATVWDSTPHAVELSSTSSTP